MTRLLGADMHGRNYQDEARKIVLDYANDWLEKGGRHIKLTFEDVFVIWFSVTLGNWKGLFGTTLPDGMYYEITYNAMKRTAYIDAYKKIDNVERPDQEDPDAKDGSGGGVYQG